MTAPQPTAGHDDSYYLARARAGEPDAYAELYRRHHLAVLRAAWAIAGPSLAEELTAEAFTNTLRALRRGGGPDHGFRTYLVTAVRHAHIDFSRRTQRVLNVDDIAAYSDLADDPVDPWQVLLENAIVRDAFATLPERWREVLWRREVEGRSVSEVGEMLGISAGAVAQLDYRAREGLRRAYLDQHSASAEGTCRRLLDQPARNARPTTGRLRPRRENCPTPCVERPRPPLASVTRSPAS